MDPISMNLRSISCKGIKSFNLFQKPSAYAVISVTDPSNPDGKLKKHKTAADSDGGENPEWAESFRFDLDSGRGDIALEVDVMVLGSLLLLLPDRTVGRVNVPIADLLAEGGDGSVRHVSYQVVGTDGNPNGVLAFSYNFSFPAVSIPPGGCCPTPPYNLDSVVPSPAGNCYPPRDQGIPLPAGDYYPPPPPHQHSPAVPSPAGDYYPPPHQQYGSAISSLAADYYPPPHQQYPMTSSPSSECYPPPRQQEPVIVFPAADCCPPPRQQYPVVSSPASGYYPQPVVCYPPPGTEVDCYAPPPPPPVHVSYHPPCAPQQPACCYPPPPPHDGYRPESWEDRLY